MNNGNYYNGNYNGDYNNNGCPPPPANNGDIFTPGPSGKSGGVAGVIITLCLCGIPSIIWLIQGILMLCMNQQDFERKYVYSTSTFPLF